MLLKVRQNFPHVSLVEVPSNSENSLRIDALQIVDVVIETLYFSQEGSRI